MLRKYSDPEVLAQISGLALRARKVVEGTISGQHRSPFHGFAVEFAEHREYSPGDDLRRLDWRVFGRTDRHYIKQYEQETNLRGTLIVDASASMQYGGQQPSSSKRARLSKFDYAATLAASLAALLIRQQDPIGLALFDNQPRDYLPPAATPSQFQQILLQLENAAPDRTTELGIVLQQLGEKIRRRGLLVLLSDMLTDLDLFWDGISRLLFRGHEILLIHILDRDEVELPFNDLVLFKDIEGSEEIFAEPYGFKRAYQAAMQEFMDEVRRECGSRRIDYLQLFTDEDLGTAISHYLHKRNQLQHLRI